MKKIICILIGLILIISFAGCGGSNGAMVVDPNAQGGSKTQGSQENPGEAAAAGQDLYFESGGVKIRPYDLIDDVVKSIGQPNDTFEAPSCAYQGMDVFYYYSGFQLTVNDLDGANHVTVVMMVDDTVSIPQGVKVGQTEEKMQELMGDSLKAEGTLYRMESGTTTLQIQIKEGSVASIMYIYNSPNNTAE
jgi:hypothetical protein